MALSRKSPSRSRGTRQDLCGEKTNHAEHGVSYPALKGGACESFAGLARGTSPIVQTLATGRTVE